MMENRQSSYPNTCRMNSSPNNPSANTRPAPAPVPCRKDLMDKINLYSFAMNEANLFLDTHPYDTEAMAYFQKHRELRMEAVKEYSKHYAPLVIDHAVCDKTPFSWVNEPWPWEGVEC